jgi:hypothetical protein
LFAKSKYIGRIILSLILFILLPIISSYAETITYRYNDARQLERVEYDNGMVIEYFYDEVGNKERKVVTRTLADSDGDGFTDKEDNCPDIYNIDQSDGDSDGVGDECDNCRDVANPDQRDTNSGEDDNLSIEGEQHYGDICDPDFNNNGIAGLDDFNEFRRYFRRTVPPAPAEVDMNGNGIIGFDDFGIWRKYFRKAPGPGVGD